MDKMYDEKMNCCDPFAPPNQLPYPAVAGELLVTKSDFSLPARPDLLEWKKIEEIIGVYDIFLTFNSERLTATLYKIVNGETIEVGIIGNVSPENSQKLDKIPYIKYYLTADVDNHTIKLYGVKPDETSEQVGDDISYISYTEYSEKITALEEWILGNTQRIERNEINIANHETRITNSEQALQSHDMRISTNEANIEANRQNIEINRQNIANNTDDIETIFNKLEVDEQNISNLQNGLSSLLNDFNVVKNDVNTLIKPVINTLIQATNPNLLLAKGEDGVELVWVNRVAIDNVKLVINNETRTITLYQSINGSEVVVGMWDKVSLEIVDWLVDTLTPISNNLNETSQPNFVLTKLADGKGYDWQSLKDVFSITVYDESDTNFLLIKLITNNDNEEIIGEFIVPKPIFINDLLDRVIYLENKKQEGNVKIFNNETEYEEALLQLLDGTISLIGDE